MMSRYDYLIGIDPDCEQSGVAVLNVKERHIEYGNYSFADLLDFLHKVSMEKEPGTYSVVVEAGYMHTANWHIPPRTRPSIAAAIGNKVGRNHETGRKIVEMCRHWNIPVEEALPLKKCWHGKDGKITHEELQDMLRLSGFNQMPARTNQDLRDSVLITIVHSRIPLRYIPRKK